MLFYLLDVDGIQRGAVHFENHKLFLYFTAATKFAKS